MNSTESQSTLGAGVLWQPFFFFLPLDFTAESYHPLLSQVNEGQLMLENRVQYGEHERKVGVCIAVSWARGEMFTNSSEATFGPLLKTRGLQI